MKILELVEFNSIESWFQIGIASHVVPVVYPEMHILIDGLVFYLRYVAFMLLFVHSPNQSVNHLFVTD